MDQFAQIKTTFFSEPGRRPSKQPSATIWHLKLKFYCVNTPYPMDNMLNRPAQTGPPNIRKRRPGFPPAGRSSHCTRQVAHHTSFLSRQPDVISSFSFGACTACTEYLEFWNFLRFFDFVEVFYLTTLLFTSIHIIDYYVFS